MKVDAHEHLTSKRVAGGVVRDHQTVVYPRLLPEGTPFLFITLGTGEHFRAPYGERARWVRIRDFYGALEAIAYSDPLINGWREAIGNEIDLQDRCFSGDRSRIEDYRGRTWSLYFLGRLKERLLKSLSGRSIDIDPTVYTVGTGPDTILHFGWPKFPAYIEINNNGLLNLKINLEEQAAGEEKEDLFENAQNYYQDLLKQFDPSLNMRKLDPGAKTKTVMSFDIGIESQNGNLSHASTEEETVRKLAEILEPFCEKPDPT